MKIIITGALGHIGSKLIRQLPDYFDNLEIVMVDNLSTQRYCSLFNLPNNAKYNFIEANIKNVEWENIFKNCDAVIHLAALTDAAGTADRPDDVHHNNFESTKLLADLCLAHKIPFLFPSSTSVYGSQDSLVDETCKELQPQSPYAECKINEENYINELCRKGLKGVICRLGTIYGVSTGMRFHTAVNKFCWQAVMAQPVTVWKTAMNQKRPYLSLDDCVNAFTWILKNHLFNGEIYNIVSNNFTVQDVIEEIKKYIPSLEINMVDHQIMNQLSYEINAQKFKNTGFNFDAYFEKSIEATITLLKNANSSNLL